MFGLGLVLGFRLGLGLGLYLIIRAKVSARMMPNH